MKADGLLILDEPTATLPGADVHRLFAVIHRLKAAGTSILYVSHHLDEVFELAEEVTVLRDALSRRDGAGLDLDHDKLIDLIVGHRVDAALASQPNSSGTPVLVVRDLRGGNVHGIDLDVYEGEIVGLAGITGSGREHVLELIAGQMPRLDGDVEINTVEVANSGRAPPSAPGRPSFLPIER